MSPCFVRVHPGDPFEDFALALRDLVVQLLWFFEELFADLADQLARWTPARGDGT